jgi:hypothetical protein
MPARPAECPADHLAEADHLPRQWGQGPPAGDRSGACAGFLVVGNTGKQVAQRGAAENHPLAPTRDKRTYRACWN